MTKINHAVVVAEGELKNKKVKAKKSAYFANHFIFHFTTYAFTYVAI